MFVMFDLDNTLVDRAEAVDEWSGEFCRAFGLSEADRAWINATDNDGYSTRRAVFTSIRDRFDLEPAVDQLLADYQLRVIELVRPTHGARDCLLTVRSRGWQSAIVSNGSSRQQHAKIDALDFRPLVDAVAVSADLDIKKPDPRIFETAAELAGTSLEGAWMVGDSALHDVVGAQRLGMNTAWLHRGRAWNNDLAVPDLVLDSLHGLAAAIDQLDSA